MLLCKLLSIDTQLSQDIWCYHCLSVVAFASGVCSMGNAAVNGSFSTSRPFGAMSQQPTPPEVKQAMEENPGCAFSTSSRSSFTSMNGDVSRKTVQSWLMTCPNQPTMKILEEEHTETGDSARASAGAGQCRC